MARKAKTPKSTPAADPAATDATETNPQADDAGKVSARALTADLAKRCGVKPSEVISHRVYADHIAVVCMDAKRCWKERLELGA